MITMGESEATAIVQEPGVKRLGEPFEVGNVSGGEAIAVTIDESGSNHGHDRLYFGVPLMAFGRWGCEPRQIEQPVVAPMRCMKPCDIRGR